MSSSGNHADPNKPSAREVRDLLSQGNRRFQEGSPQHPHTGPGRRQLAAAGDQAEHALATVLACSDSRVPVEHIFDVGVMDIFVVRVAGNIISRSTLASLEYGVLHVHTPLLVVLGHSDCGAVTSALAWQGGGPAPREEKVRWLLERIVPVAGRARAALPGRDGSEVLDRAVEENVRQSLEDILSLSPPLAQAAGQGSFAAVGAIYDLPSGRVRWLDHGPGQAADT